MEMNLFILLYATFAVAHCSLIRFEPGKQYEYKYSSKTSLVDVDEFQVTARVLLITIEEKGEEQEVQLLMEDFNFWSEKNSDAGRANVDMPDMTKWFSFTITSVGEIHKICYNDEEDPDVLAIKKGIVSLLSGKFIDRTEDHNGEDSGRWQYKTVEKGHEGDHEASYNVVVTQEGKTFTKNRTRCKNIPEHSDSSMLKSVTIDHNTGIIHSVSSKEHVEMSNRVKPGFNPEEGMRKVEAVNDFEDVELPSMRAESSGNLVFLKVIDKANSPKKPKNVTYHDIQHKGPVSNMRMSFHGENVTSLLKMARENIACIASIPTSDSEAFVTNGSKQLLDCHHDLVKTMYTLPNMEVTKLVDQIFQENRRLFKSSVHQSIIINTLFSMETDLAQDLIVKYTLENPKVDKALLYRTVLLLGNIRSPPSKDMLGFFQSMLDDDIDAIYDRYGPETASSLLLSLGSLSHQWMNHQEGSTLALKFNEKIKNTLGVHDPYAYRMKRSTMTEPEALQSDWRKVVLLETLGNGRHTSSFEIVLSHTNSTVSSWVKRAAIHALRDYNHLKAAEAILKAASDDENSEVRHEAWVAYQIHPAADETRIKRYAAENEKEHVLSRHKRGVLDKEHQWRIEAPGLDFRKHLGTQQIGAAFGVAMINYFDLRISPLSGHFKVEIHDEVYARALLGIIGFNFDFFSARICFKGGATYNLNILQEYDSRLNEETVRLLTEGLTEVAKAIETAIDLITELINSDISLELIVEEFVQVFKELPNMVREVREAAIDAVESFGELLQENIPPFLQPMKALIDYVSNLMSDIKLDVMDFYYSLVQAVQIKIPRAVKMIIDSVKNIIKAFPDLVKNPKKSVARIGGGVLGITVSVAELQTVRDDVMGSSFLKGEKPYWMDFKAIFEKIKDMSEAAFTNFWERANDWIEEVASAEDPIKELTGGKMSQALIRETIINSIADIIERLFAPFEKLMDIGDGFIEKFVKIFQLVSDLREGVEKVKTGYKAARALIDKVFGPKFDSNFPKLIRESDTCIQNGFFPSKNLPYEYKGVDLVVAEGSEIVAPLSGKIERTNTYNQARLWDIDELPEGQEILIDNVQLDDGIFNPNEDYSIEKHVAAGQKIGVAAKSQCTNHIHVVLKNEDGVLDPSRLLAPRPPEQPEWRQRCNDKRVVLKGETKIAEPLVPGVEVDDTSESLPDDGERPEEVNEDKVPEITGNAVSEAVDNKPALKTGSFLEKAGDMFEILLKRTKAFLENFSVRRIKLGPAVEFLHTLGLTDSVDKIADILRKIKAVMDETPCVAPSQMTDDELQTQLVNRGLPVTGDRRTMVETLTKPDSRCPYIAMAMRKFFNMHCFYGLECLEMECCVRFEILKTFQKTYRAFFRIDVDNAVLILGFDKWRKEISLAVDSYIKDEENTIDTGITFDLIEARLICKYELEASKTDLILSYGCGMCRDKDALDCINFVYILEDAVFTFPHVTSDGTIVYEEVDFEKYFDRERISQDFEEAGEQLLEEVTSSIAEEIIDMLGIPKEILKDNPRCPIYRNMEEDELIETLESRNLATDGTTEDMIDRLTFADKSCTLKNGQSMQFPVINNDAVEKVFMYTVSEDCMRFDACLDVYFPILDVTKTFTAAIWLDPCNFKIHFEFENYQKWKWLIDYNWGNEDTFIITDKIYMRYTLDKKDDEFILTAALIAEVTDTIDFDSTFIDNMHIPIPICNGDFRLPGAGDLTSFAESIGGKLSEEAFDVFAELTGIDEFLQNEEKCTLPSDPNNCDADPLDFIPPPLQDILHCKMLDNCWGVSCCLDFGFDIPLSDKQMSVSIPFLFQYDPCLYFVKIKAGKDYERTRWLVEYDWGTTKTLPIGKGSQPPIVISYTIDKDDTSFIIDAKMSICLPLREGQYCIPDDDGLHVLKNEPVSLCLLGVDSSDGGYLNFSLTEWLEDRGREIGDALGEAGRDYIIEALNLEDVVQDEPCNISLYPYSPRTNGWNIECGLSHVPSLDLPDFIACHVSSDCKTLSCCVDIHQIGFNLGVAVDLDLCQNKIISSIEKVNNGVENALSDYKWGENKTSSILKVFEFSYNIGRPTTNAYVVNAYFNACFERSGDCLIDEHLIKDFEIPRIFCRPTDLVEAYLANVTYQCSLDADLQGIMCDIGDMLVDSTKPNVYFRVDPCMNKFSLQVGDVQLDGTLSSLEIDSEYSQDLEDGLSLLYTLDESPQSYYITIKVGTCASNDGTESCDSETVLTKFPLYKANCSSNKRRKRNVEDVESRNIQEALREFRKREYTSEEINGYLRDMKLQEELLREEEFTWVPIGDADSTTKTSSLLKSLGIHNPMAMMHANKDTEWKFELEVKGGDAILDILNQTDKVIGKASQLYVAGEGLTKLGVQLLGKQLANMTIGDLEAFLEMNRVDPEVIHDLLVDLVDLAKTLYAETVDAITSGELGNAFDAFEMSLRGSFNYPFHHGHLLPPLPAIVIPMGPVFISFYYGADYFLGINVGVGVRVMAMTTDATITPYAGISVWGGASFGFILYAEIHLRGYIMDIRFPTRAELDFSRFPIKVGLKMDLVMVPFRMTLIGKVTLKIRIPFCCSFRKTLFQAVLWSYTSKPISSNILDNTRRERDETPPVFTPIVADPLDTTDVSLADVAHCQVKQLAGLDYTEPAFQIEVAAEDNLSGLRFFLDVGTYPGGKNTLEEFQLGGAMTKLSMPLKDTGVPLYFTMHAQNSQGTRSSVTCELVAYDVTVPTGRATAEFSSTSNPQVIRAVITAHDEVDIPQTLASVGFGKELYGDQVVEWHDVEFQEISDDAIQGITPSEEISYFSGMKEGRLIGGVLHTRLNVFRVSECAAWCRAFAKHSCLSFNYDYGTTGTCEILKAVEGHDHIIVKDGLFSHYERLGTGLLVELRKDNLNLTHNFLYFVNLYMNNSLGYENVISSQGILPDFTPPEPGLVENKQNDYPELKDCSVLIPEDRKELLRYCIGLDHDMLNHRVVIDGPGSATVFNGMHELYDERYTRINTYISANWDGFHDNETSIRVYTWAVGTEPCEELIHPHHDPHAHLLSELQWNHKGQIYPLPPPYTVLPDRAYYVTVRALNRVEYGGPLAISVCHTTPYVVDTSPPYVHEISNIRYDENSYFIYADIDIGDPHSGISEYDLCLGKSSHDCSVLAWYRYNFDQNRKVSHRFQLPDGIPTWLRIRAVNNVHLSTVGVSGQALVVDATPPIAGLVNDGPIYKVDQQFSKDPDQICANWDGFYDPESGISAYLVGFGSDRGKTDILSLREISYKEHYACLELPTHARLEHGMTYYAIVYAMNGGIVRRNISAVSDGVTIDLTPPETGEIIDGDTETFEDIEYSSSESTVDAQWRGIADHESSIMDHSVKIQVHRSDGSFILKNWTSLGHAVEKVSWKNFHLNHNDFVQSELKITNGASNTATLETNGFIVDLTAPVLGYIHDGNDETTDQQYQSNNNSLSVNFDVADPESGIRGTTFQILEKYNGNRKQIWPEDRQWHLETDLSLKYFSVGDLVLIPGAKYTFVVATENNAGLTSIHETNGIIVDPTPPTVRWLHVGVFYGETEDIHDGFVYQSDHSGIKMSYLAFDAQSGITEAFVKVGTSPGSDDIKTSSTFEATEKNIYLTNFALIDTDRQTMSPVYYVTLVVKNGAGDVSDEIVSTPIVVVPEDVPGIVADGIVTSDNIFIGDVDYTFDDSTMKVTFDGFQSTLYGIKMFTWAVGTAPGTENVLPFTEKGITYEERIENDVSVYSGMAHLPVSLEHGLTYFVTVRAITHGGHSLQSVSDGIMIDKTPPLITIDSLLEIEIEKDQGVYFTKDIQTLDASWTAKDTELISSEISDNIDYVAIQIGSLPGASDILATYYSTALETTSGELVDAVIISDGSPNFLTITAMNKAGLRTMLVAPAAVVDDTLPVPGQIMCSEYAQPNTPIYCEWSGFTDAESPITTYKLFFGSQPGYDDVLPVVLLNATTTDILINTINNADHGDEIYATVVVVNSVDKEVAAYSSAIYIDTTPPSPRAVVEVAQEHVTLSGENMPVDESCDTEQECTKQDIICQTSLTSITVRWSPFDDPESGINSYYVAVGTTESSTDILGFTQISQIPENRKYTITGLHLMGIRQVFVKVMAVNGVGMSTVSTSNGVYISYIKQGLNPLSHIAVWDADLTDNGDIDYQLDTSTLRAKWDVSGEPCPVQMYEWSALRLDGVIIQNFTNTDGSTEAFNDQLTLNNGETYYFLLRVTNVDGYSYILRSNGVTIRTDTLASGIVNDGDVVGYDLNVLPSRAMVSCNWNGFGESIVSDHEDVLTGNGGVEQDVPDYQTVSHYEVALGTDRRFAETRANIVPFTNVGTNKQHTFKNLELIPGTAKYYFTVRAYSVTGSTTQSMSNGFYISFNGGVSAGTIQIPTFTPSLTSLEIPWQDFTSREDMMLYYVALSTRYQPTATDCKKYVSGGNMTEDQLEELFDVQTVTNNGESTVALLDDLSLNQGQLYYVFVMGVDYAGECNMTIANTTVDVTGPDMGFVTGGPYFGMVLSYTSDESSIHVHWGGFADDVSGIKSYNVSLLSGESCLNDTVKTQISDSFILDADVHSFVFYNLELEGQKPYFARLVVTNGAGLTVEEYTEPILVDTSVPTAGAVVEGSVFNGDVVWWGSTSQMTGTILHYQNPSGESCPSQRISFGDDSWNMIEGTRLIDNEANAWNIDYRPELVSIDETTGNLKLKLSVASSFDRMITGGIYRPADMDNTSTYQITLKPATGDYTDPYSIVTEISFIDADPQSGFTSNFRTQNGDWDDEDCSCCFDTSLSAECSCSNCSAFIENYNDNGGSSQTMVESRTRACGLQIYTGPDPFGVLWCSFTDSSIPIMEVKFSLPANIVETFNMYTIKFYEEQEDQSPQSCIMVSLDEQVLGSLCGIPELSSATNFLLHVWNRDRHVPSQDEDLFTWNVVAEVQDVVFPPALTELCRFGEPFRGGDNPIVRYEAAVGSAPGLSDVHPFEEVFTPCIPCTDTCSNYNCDTSCNINEMTLHTFTLTGLNLESHTEGENYTELINYYLTVKAVLGSGNIATASSNGFYVDVTPPEFDEVPLLYIDVDQGEYTPVKYQGSTSTIKCIWTCDDEQSEITEYDWAIGTNPGLQDVQPFTSTGKNSWGINDGLQGILENNGSYYVSVRCINEAGLMTTYTDPDTGGVVVLTDPPEPDAVGGHIVAAEAFGYDIYPPNSMKTSDPTSVGVSIEVSQDPSIERYEFCLGSKLTTPGDIIQCVWVVYNTSADIRVENGCLMYNGQKAYDLNELRQDATASESGGTFRMEPGRVIFVTIRLCNVAAKCSYKHVGTVTIVDDDTTQSGVSNGEGSLYFRIGTGGATRKKRSVSDESLQVQIITPENLTIGETVLVMSLTDEDLTADYSSSSSTEFVPYIVNPNTTLNQTERILLGRIQEVLVSFSIVTVGQFEMPGPLLIEHTQINNDPNPGDMVHAVIHWNPDNQEWQLTEGTCQFENNSVVQNEVNETTTIKVCNTRQHGQTEEVYLREQTQFVVVLMNADVSNNAPYLTSPTNITFDENQETFEYQFNASDPEDDDVQYTLVSGSNNEIVQNLVLSKNGSLVFEVCAYCFGQFTIEIQIYDVPTSDQIQSNSTNVNVTITITPVNDKPRIFMVGSNKESLLGADVTEELQVFKDNLVGGSVYYTAIVGAYDYDTNDQLDVLHTSSISAQGNFTVTTLNIPYTSAVNCNDSWCLGRTPEISPSQMQWIFARVSYEKYSDFTGRDEIKLAIRDSDGALSDIVTVAVYNLEMPCANRGYCTAIMSTPCDNPDRLTNFDDNYNCVCPITWTGKYCTEDVNECLRSPCAAPYQCNNSPGSYTCDIPLALILGAAIGTPILLVVIFFVSLFFCRKSKKNRRPRKQDAGRNSAWEMPGNPRRINNNTTAGTRSREGRESIQQNTDLEDTTYAFGAKGRHRNPFMKGSSLDHSHDSRVGSPANDQLPEVADLVDKTSLFGAERKSRNTSFVHDRVSVPDSNRTPEKNDLMDTTYAFGAQGRQRNPFMQGRSFDHNRVSSPANHQLPEVADLVDNTRLFGAKGKSRNTSFEHDRVSVPESIRTRETNNMVDTRNPVGSKKLQRNPFMTRMHVPAFEHSKVRDLKVGQVPEASPVLQMRDVSDMEIEGVHVPERDVWSGRNSRSTSHGQGEMNRANSALSTAGIEMKVFNKKDKMIYPPPDYWQFD